MDTDIYRKFDKYCLLLQSYLCIAAILLLSFGIDVILFSSSALAEPPVYYLNSDQLNDHSLNWSTSDYWSNADGSSPSNIPDNVNGCIFAVGDGYMLRTPEVDTPQTFPYNELGEYNKLYIGYNHNASAFDTGYLNLKCESVKIDNLVLGNGVIDQGLFNSHVTLQGSITVVGNATVMINDESSHEDRLLTIESSIAGSGTLNFTTAYRESRIGFHLTSSSNSFNGSIVVDNKSSISFEAEDVFVNASSITSAGDLTISANQTFNAPLNCTDGSVTLKAELNLNAGGTLYNLSGNSSGKLISAQDFTINNDSETTYYGLIYSEKGKLIKTGKGTLIVDSKTDKSINCEVVINEGTFALSNRNNTYIDRFGGNVTINAGATLECKFKDAIGNGDTNITFNINGGRLYLTTTNENQTLMNKTLNLTGGLIEMKYAECKGIEIKTGSSINVYSVDVDADEPTVSTISVPIKVRENHLLPINVESNAKLVFSGPIYKADDRTQGIKKLGEGVLVFSGTFYDPKTSANTYTSKITVSEGVVQLKDEALTTYGQIEVVKSNNDGIITKGTLELFVDRNDLKSMTITNANKIFGTGDIKKTGDGTLKIVSETQGMISAESMFVSSGQLDFQGYMGGTISVGSGSVFSPADSIESIGEATFGGGFILNDAGSELLMEIGGQNIGDNDFLVASGDLTFHNGSFVNLVATDDRDWQPGDTFTAVLSGNNSEYLKNNNFISRYVRSNDFVDLQYIQLTSGEHSGKYAITGRYQINLNAVPEPSTWALLILGVAGLLYLRTRKNSNLRRFF